MLKKKYENGTINRIRFLKEILRDLNWIIKGFNTFEKKNIYIYIDYKTRKKIIKILLLMMMVLKSSGFITIKKVSNKKKRERERSIFLFVTIFLKFCCK